MVLFAVMFIHYVTFCVLQMLAISGMLFIYLLTFTLQKLMLIIGKYAHNISRIL